MTESAFLHGQMQAALDDHERRLAALDNHIAQSAQALEGIRLQLARVMVLVPVIVVMSNAFVALVMYEITR